MRPLIRRGNNTLKAQWVSKNDTHDKHYICIKAIIVREKKTLKYIKTYCFNLMFVLCVRYALRGACAFCPDLYVCDTH